MRDLHCFDSPEADSLSIGLRQIAVTRTSDADAFPRAGIPRKNGDRPCRISGTDWEMRISAARYQLIPKGVALTDELKTKKHSLSERIGSHMEVFVSLAALITAVAAVVITLEQTKVMREEAELERNNARISVLPSVWLSTYIGDIEGEAYYKVVLTNKGLGPAVIERFEVSYQGQPVYNWDELARKIAADLGADKSFEGNYLRSSRSPVSPGLMLEAGGSASPLQVDGETEPDGISLLMRGSRDVGISLCYCSLYSDCFRTELFERPQELESCESSEKPFISHGFFKN